MSDSRNAPDAHDLSPAVATATAIVSAIVGISATLASLSWSSAVTVGLLVVAIGVWIPALSRRVRDWHGWSWVFTALISGASLTGAGWRIYNPPPTCPAASSCVSAASSDATPSRAPTANATNSPPARPAMSFTPPTGSIPLCNTFSGSGVIPAGFTLWILDRENSSADPYYFEGKATQQSGSTWTAEPIDIGVGAADAGHQFLITAVLLSNDFSQWLSTLDLSSGLPSPRLPPGAQQVDEITVTRNADAQKCP
jgi:hypothetical protein